MAPRPFLIAGEHVTTDDVRAIHSPYDDRVVSEVCWANADHLDAAIAAADGVRAQLAAEPAHVRAERLETARRLLDDAQDELAEVICDEAGKPIASARVEASRCLDTFTDAAWAARDALDHMAPLDALGAGAGRRGFVKRVPVGPVAAITPFNFPLNLVAHKLAPAIAAGCPVVLKPASQTPTAALMLADILVEAGVPSGALSVLPLDVEDGGPLTSDRRMRFLSFTGSAEVGWALKQQAVHMHVALELGGNAGTYVAADADLDAAIPALASGAFGYAGQTCISVQRILVHRSIFDTFVGRYCDHVAAHVTCGDPRDPDVVVGPVIRARDAERILGWVEEARAGGAQIRLGGGREGQVVHPTVLTNVSSDMKVCADEVFGPVVSIVPVDSDDEGLATLDDSDYGLQAGLFTNDLQLVMKAWDRLHVGGLIHNGPSAFRVDLMPYGGTKDSGIGREGPCQAVREMTEERILVITDG